MNFQGVQGLYQPTPVIPSAVLDELGMIRIGVIHHIRQATYAGSRRWEAGARSRCSVQKKPLWALDGLLVKNTTTTTHTTIVNYSTYGFLWMLMDTYGIQ